MAPVLRRMMGAAPSVSLGRAQMYYPCTKPGISGGYDMLGCKLDGNASQVLKRLSAPERPRYAPPPPRSLFW